MVCWWWTRLLELRGRDFEVPVDFRSHDLLSKVCDLLERRHLRLPLMGMVATQWSLVGSNPDRESYWPSPMN